MSAIQYDSFGLAVAAFEASPEVSPFTSNYDYVQAGKDQFTPQEARGSALFRGKAGCNQRHRDGGPGEGPLFTDFTASNPGVPRNPELQYYYESTSDRRGYRSRLVRRDKPSSTKVSGPSYARCKATAAN